jgi:ribosomal protein S18 acetylase RimI-like enzyme
MSSRHVCAPDIRVANSMARLHMAAFPGFFITSLGHRFVCLLYLGFMSQPDGICLVAEEGSEVVGFAVGTSAPPSFFRKLLLGRSLRFAFAAIPGLLRNPLFVMRKCFGALFYTGESPKDIPAATLLSSLAVSPSAQNRGMGTSLVKAFAEEADRRGASAIYLLTDKTDNERANSFYRGCGFTLLDTFLRPRQRTMNRWVMQLT